MTSAFFWVSDTPWCLCQPIISFWHTPWGLKWTRSLVNSPEPKTIIFRIQFISIRVNRICVTYDIGHETTNHQFVQNGVQLSLVRPIKTCFGWIPMISWIFHHSSSFLMTLVPFSSTFVSFLSHHWMFNVATTFVNGP